MLTVDAAATMASSSSSWSLLVKKVCGGARYRSVLGPKDIGLPAPGKCGVVEREGECRVNASEEEEQKNGWG